MCVEPLELRNSIEKLNSDLCRWQRKLQQADMGPTDIIGVVIKAFNQFEVVLRQSLSRYLEAAGVDYDQDLKQQFKGKGLHDLTLGELVTCFDKVNGQLTKWCREHLGGSAAVLGGRKLLIQAEIQVLRRISSLRKSLHRDNMAPTLVDAAPGLLDDVEAVLKMPLFELCPEGSA